MGLQIKGLLSVCIFRERTQHIFQRFRSSRRLCLNNWTWLLGIGDRQGQRQQTSSGSKDYPSNSRGGRATIVHPTSPNLFFSVNISLKLQLSAPKQQRSSEPKQVVQLNINSQEPPVLFRWKKEDVWISEIQYSNMVAISLAMNTNMNDMD